MDAADAVFVDVASHQGGGVGLHIPADLHIPPGGIAPLLLDPRRLPLQNGSQVRGNLGKIRPGLLQLPRIEVDIFHADIGGQHIHVPVMDLPPAGGHCGGTGLVFQGQPCVVVVV